MYMCMSSIQTLNFICSHLPQLGFFFYYWVCISCDVLENLSPGQDACMKDYPIETVNFKCLDIKQQGIYEIKSLRY